MRAADEPASGAAGSDSPSQARKSRSGSGGAPAGSGGAPAARRGRPRKPKADDFAHGLHIEDPTDSLPTSARGILAAARTVLTEHGFEGLTIEAVANEANVSRTLIPYHFGSRAGLVATLIDSLFHDAAVEIWQRRGAAPARGDLSGFLQLVRQEGEDIAGQRDFFELIVCAQRDDLLRKRVAGLFGAYRALDLDLAGIPAGEGSPWRSDAVGAVLQAITDGLALQAVFDPEFDLDAAVDAAGRLLGPALATHEPRHLSS